LIRKLRESVPGLSIVAISSGVRNLPRDDVAKLGVAELLTKLITPGWKPKCKDLLSLTDRVWRVLTESFCCLVNRATRIKEIESAA